MNLQVEKDYLDPENNSLEIIERKGMGHPDTLADKLAEECSHVYSNYCMQNFGCILHHNFDKLYIGAGCFRYENEEEKMYQPIKVFLNGRASNTMNSKKIDIEALLVPVIKKYLSSVLPRLDVEKELIININCTQNTKVRNWFTPQSIEDVPDAKELFANDTSLCVSHFPLTTCENIALEVEQLFWEYGNDGYPKPKFNEIGQDIKIMIIRTKNDVTVSIGVPVYPTEFNDKREYINIIKKYEKMVAEKIKEISKNSKYKFNVQINRSKNKDYHMFLLIKGSCIECGEEGVVGRGNNSQGLISSFRQHTMEAPCGKNERYHTGRVLSFLGNRATKRIYEECGVKSSFFSLAQNKDYLLKPVLMYLSVDREVDHDKIRKIIEEEFDENTYLDKLLSSRKLI